MQGGGVTGRPTRTPLRRLTALMLMLAVSGCGGYSQTTSMEGLAAPTPGSAPENATPVDPGVAQTLEHGTAGERLQYKSAEGRQLSLVLGPIYTSARGVPCRLGRAGRVGASGASPTSYPFCRLDNGWYEVTPVVISGY